MRGGKQEMRGGFTLIEVLLGMGVAIMVIVGVVAVSVATTRLTATIADAESEALRVDMLEQILRDNLEHLPQRAAYMSIEPETGEAVRVLAIENAFGAFSLGDYGMSADRYLFRPVAVDGGLMLRLEYYLKEDDELSWFEEPYLPDPSTAQASINLIGGLRSVSWWQLMAAEEEWVPIELVDQQTQPAALRLDMVLQDGEAMSWTFRNPMWKLDQVGGLRSGGQGGNRVGGGQDADQGGGRPGQGVGQGGGRPGQGAGQGDGRPGQRAEQGGGRGGQQGGGRDGQQVRPQIPNGSGGRGGGR